MFYWWQYLLFESFVLIFNINSFTFIRDDYQESPGTGTAVRPCTRTVNGVVVTWYDPLLNWDSIEPVRSLSEAKISWISRSDFRMAGIQSVTEKLYSWGTGHGIVLSFGIKKNVLPHIITVPLSWALLIRLFSKSSVTLGDPLVTKPQP